MVPKRASGGKPKFVGWLDLPKGLPGGGDGHFSGSRQVAIARLVHLPDGRIEPVKMTD